ncbi:MAG: TolC family protein [Daejeonella sp.]|uniref:TolC family protein n=1 Tax=Daejeonella sp. TaxID=2805397 RepID=UPI003C70ABF0
MKKTGLLCLIILLGVATSYGQQSLVSQINYNQLEKYIQSAKDNYPRRQIMALNTEVVAADVPAAKVSYLDIFNASYIYRPNNAVALNAANPFLVNGFQFGVSMTLGNFLQKPFQVKKAQSELKIAKLEQQEYDVILANEVKSRYYAYILQLNELKLRTQSAQDNKTVSDDMRYKFEKGEITLQAYNSSRISATGADSSRIQAEIDFLKAKDALEEIIGKKLEEVN